MSYCHSAPSVRPSSSVVVVVRKLSHFRLILQFTEPKVTQEFIKYLQSHNLVLELWGTQGTHYLQSRPYKMFLAHLSRRLKWAIVIAHRPSVRRRPSSSSSVNFHIFDLFSRTAWWILMKLGRDGPLQVLLFFGQIRLGADPGWGKNRSRGVPFFKKLLLQTGRLQRQTECIAMI